jgi:hypothetical protein
MTGPEVSCGIKIIDSVMRWERLFLEMSHYRMSFVNDSWDQGVKKDSYRFLPDVTTRNAENSARQYFYSSSYLLLRGSLLDFSIS